MFSRSPLLIAAVLVATTLAFAVDTPANLPSNLAIREVRQCVQCHPAQAKPHVLTSMAHAMETVEECTVLREHPLLSFKSGPYSYTIKRDGKQSQYTVTDGSETLTVPVGWAFGLGMAGQTYVFEYQGEYYESRVSFYQELHGLDFTMGAQGTQPRNLLEAAGRHMSSREGLECFNCHATHSVVGQKLDVTALTAGVQCERCHGSADAHLSAFKTGKMENAAMKHLTKLSSEETNDFCGQCHRTWSQIAGSGPTGVGNVRFQPYRITNSKCYDADDARIRCVACHNPHENLVRNNLAAYDAKCTACHATAASPKPAKLCPVAKDNCASCHMPKTAMPGAHHLFTDHQIRIVRAGDKYPN